MINRESSFDERNTIFRTKDNRLNNMIFNKNIETNGEYKAKVSGNFGEYKLSSILNSLPDEFHIIDNVMLKTRKGSTQIDHIIVSPYGIHIIETKNHKGMIFGDDKSRVWTQVLRGRHNTFYSPVLQNAGHIEAISKAIKIRKDLLRGLIVFTNEEANLCNVKCVFCLNPEQLYDKLMYGRKRAILSDEQVWKAIRRIDSVNIDSYENRRKHIEYVKRQQVDKKRIVY